MGHEGHHHEEKKPLSFFASPLHEPSAHDHTTANHHDRQGSGSDIEMVHKPHHQHDPNGPNYENMDCSLHDTPAYHRHAEATTSELFYDLFFVANLTSFTSIQEINNRHSLTSYVGFFSLLWLTWYQVSLYDVRFSTDSIFERMAKSIHFGVMVGFAVMGAQWHPGQEVDSFTIYKSFGLILMVSRLTLFLQYAVTLFYSKKHRKTILPLSLVMGMTLLSAIIYAATVASFPKKMFDANGNRIMSKSNVYIAWYIIGLSETILTVAVSCIWRIVSFKGTHMVQRMSLLTLIILGEGIIVICKSIAKIVKNKYLWTGAVVGQIVAAVLIIYFLYMLYFDRMQEEHFGSIRQQVWSFLHFPLHIVLVLVLQGVSLLIIWRQAVTSIDSLYTKWEPALNWGVGNDIDNSSAFAVNWLNKVPDTFETQGVAFAAYMNYTCYSEVYDSIPKGVDSNKEEKVVEDSYYNLVEAIDYRRADPSNDTAWDEYFNAVNDMTSATFKTLFDTFSVTLPKPKKSKGGDQDKKQQQAKFEQTITGYYKVFDLIMTYSFISVSISLLI